MFKNIKIKTEWGNSAWHFSFNGEDYAHVMETEDMILIVKDMLDTMKKLKKREKK